MKVARSLEEPSICLSLEDLTMFSAFGGALEGTDEASFVEGDDSSDLTDLS